MFAEDMPKIVAGYFDLFDAVELHFKNTYTMEGWTAGRDDSEENSQQDS